MQFAAVLYEGCTLVNTTPHAINVLDYRTHEVRFSIPAAPQPLRLEERLEHVGNLAGVPLVRKSLVANISLPEPQEGVFYVVPLAVAQMLQRPDFVVPDDLVRDDQGRVIGCRRFATVI